MGYIIIYLILLINTFFGTFLGAIFGNKLLAISTFIYDLIIIILFTIIIVI